MSYLLLVVIGNSIKDMLIRTCLFTTSRLAFDICFNYDVFFDNSIPSWPTMLCVVLGTFCNHMMIVSQFLFTVIISSISYWKRDLLFFRDSLLCIKSTFLWHTVCKSVIPNCSRLKRYRDLVMVDSLALAAGPDDGLGAAADVVPALSSLLLFIAVLPTISRVL